MDLPQTFIGLSQDECHYLDTWLRAAEPSGIESAADLARRRWPCAIEGALIGIFAVGDETASWLVVKHNGLWVVASCAALAVSRSVGSLAEALEAIFPGGHKQHVTS